MEDSPIIAAVDGSEASLQAVERAAREAMLRSQPLRIVSVPALPPRMVHQRGMLGRPATVTDTVRQAYTDALAEATARATATEPGLAVTTALLSGAPATVIAQLASPGSLLVVGSRGAGGLSAMIIGSVSRYVADHGAGPVVVVRQQSMTMHRKVVVGLRDADQAAVLAFAFQEAALRQAGVLVLNAWHWFLPAALLPAALRPGPNAERISADSGNWLTEVLAGWRDKYPQVDVSQEVAHASPGQALLDASAGADLVVLGRAGSKPGELGGGAVRHAILHHGECPVAVIPG